ncbi:MAG: hypothetical protein PHS79_01105 [Patescibacteria group bacterium]|nr:hypothetical protein [Patescibacteria group bacterium]
MQCKIINFETAPVDRDAIEKFLRLLPNRLTSDLHELSYRPADDLDFGKRFDGVEKHKVKGFHFSQDNKNLVVIVGPATQAADFDRLSFASRLKSLLLKSLAARTVWDNPAQRDLAHCALSVAPDEATQDAWRQALANRFYASGHGVDRVGELCRQAHSLLSRDGYDVARSAYGLSDWQKDVIKDQVRIAVKSMIKKSIEDTYERAKLMHAIFADGEYKIDQALLSQLRLLANNGDAHRVVAVRHFANVLNEI